VVKLGVEGRIRPGLQFIALLTIRRFT